MTRKSLYSKSREIIDDKVKMLRHPSQFSFIFMGDSWAGDGQTSNAIFKEALLESVKRKPLFIVHGGDAVFTGTIEQFLTGEKSTSHPKSFLQLVKEIAIANNVPMFVVPGNHETTGIKGPLKYFQELIGPLNFKIDIPKLDFTLIGLKNFFTKNGNAVYGLTNTQLNLLVKGLKTSQPITVLAMHAPPKGGKWSGDYFKDPESVFTEGLNPYLNILKRDKISLVLTSHVHTYDKTTVHGVEHIISGGAGAPLIKKGFLPSYEAQEIFHIVEVTVNIRTGYINSKVIPIGWTA